MQHHRGRLVASLALLVEQMSHRPKVGGVTRGGLGQGGVEGFGAESIEQACESDGGRAEVSSPLGNELEEALARRAGVVQPVHAPLLASVGLERGQLLDVGGILDLAANEN
jgi:hypothetical protein